MHQNCKKVKTSVILYPPVAKTSNSAGGPAASLACQSTDPRETSSSFSPLPTWPPRPFDIAQGRPSAATCDSAPLPTVRHGRIRLWRTHCIFLKVTFSDSDINQGGYRKLTYHSIIHLSSCNPTLVLRTIIHCLTIVFFSFPLTTIQARNPPPAPPGRGAR